MITNRFSKDRPISAAQGRHGELIVVQGNGVRPVRWGGSGAGVDAGVDAPTKPMEVVYTTAPETGTINYRLLAGPPVFAAQPETEGAISIDSTPAYYVARVDSQKPGACYNSAPAVTFSTDRPLPPVRGRQAKAKAYLSQAGVSEIRVDDGGKYYPLPPNVVLSDTHGKGGVIEAILDGFPEAKPCDNPTKGITQWVVATAPDSEQYPLYNDQPKFAGIDTLTTEIEIVGNGTFSLNAPLGRDPLLTGGTYINTRGGGTTNRLAYTVTGADSGACAKLKITWQGARWSSTFSSTYLPSYSRWRGATGIRSIAVVQAGDGFASDATVRITIPSVDGEQADIVIEGYGQDNPNNTGGKTYSVKALVIRNPGSGYVVAPAIQIISNSGFGAYGTVTVKDGKLDTVTLENCGGGYRFPPTVKILSGGAEAFAVARPHLRGKYQCYYRYIDNTPEDRGGPIPSSLSPVTEVDCGDGASSLTWTLPDTTTTNVPARVRNTGKIEVWRTTGNQALTVYRVGTTSTGGPFFDDLTDDELRDEDRDGYEAMPIVLPNGELNANRFTPPPKDKAAVVRFQDRFWYGVDTGGKEPNSIYFSEVDEPESVPDVNELVLQQNARDSDSVRALIPYGSTLLVMQSRHAYSLTFSKQPLLDSQVNMIAYRGCLNQRCWEVYNGICYVMDQYGIYSVSPAGDVEPISDAIKDLFKGRIDFASGTWYFLTVDPASQTLRAFVSFKEDSAGGYPSLALCYSTTTKTWWVERYPQRIAAGTPVRMSNGDFRCVYGGQGGGYLLGEGAADQARGAILTVRLTTKGRGYKKPPKVTALGGTAAQFQAAINGEGEVVAIWVTNPGFGYASGSLVISDPDDDSHPSPLRAAATFTATPTYIDTPTFPVYRYKTGISELASDKNSRDGGSTQPRSISLTYQPQPVACEAAIRAYYNNSPHPRRNFAGRDRGTGVKHVTVDHAARLDMARSPQAESDDSGVRTALFAGRTLDDIKSSDRHVAVEVAGVRKSAEPVVIYDLNVYGTAE